VAREQPGNRPLHWTSSDDAGAKRFVVAGELTEASDLHSLERELAPKNVFDLEGVERINSMGVKTWLQFMGRLRDAGKRVDFMRCSPVVVGQLNIVNSFRGAAEVHSVMAPFICPECDHEDAVLVDMNGEPHAQIEKGAKCPSCGADMEFDDLPDHYLSFVRR
jgi:ABC-type transporter Mla MlaB component